jgi:hypothetical protein
VRLRSQEIWLRSLPPELDGLRIAHLSDFHLGVPSRGIRAVDRAVDWVVERRPDIICITGDLLSRPSGQAKLDELLERLPSDPYVVLGNHDFAISRDPFSKPVEIGRLERGTLLSDSTAELEVNGKRIELAGVDPRSWLAYRPSGFEPSDADPTCTPGRSSSRTAWGGCSWRIRARGTPRGSSRRTGRRCTFLRASGRPSCRSGSLPARRPPSSFYDLGADGRS